MAKPAEAKQGRGPFVRWRLHLEDRAPIANYDLASECKASRINFGGPRCVSGAQILRRDNQAVGLKRRERPAKERMAIGAAGDAPQRPAKQKPGQLRMVRDRNARHRLRSPSPHTPPARP